MNYITIKLTEDQYNTLFDYIWEEEGRLEEVTSDEHLEKTKEFRGIFKDVTASNKRKLAYMKRLSKKFQEAKTV